MTCESGFSSSTVGHLLRHGLIISGEVPHPRPRQLMSLIVPRQLDRFLAKYAPLGLSAHQLGTQPRHVVARLDKARVRLPETCSRNYRRNEVSPVIAI